MAKATILFADNDQDFLETRATFLREEGFEVITVTDPTQARRELEKGGFDLAILDIRLLNDDDEHDLSGLKLAKEVANQVPAIVTSKFLEQWIPAIMLTQYATYENVREALTSQIGGLPPAVDFVAKTEGQEALLEAIKKALAKRENPALVLPRKRSTEQRWRPFIALAFLAGAVISGILAVTMSDPRWLAGTVALGILYAIITWLDVQ